jgi:hypothetical protein
MSRKRGVPIVMMDLALLQAEAAAGMYMKPIEVLAKEVHYEPVPDEIRVAIIAAWRRGLALPHPDIERMVPAIANQESAEGTLDDARRATSAPIYYR